MSDESKAESLGTLIIFLLLIAAVVTMDRWFPVVKDMVMPGKIVVVDCGGVK